MEGTILVVDNDRKIVDLVTLYLNATVTRFCRPTTASKRWGWPGA